jgi:hypothetical protein
VKAHSHTRLSPFLFSVSCLHQPVAISQRNHTQHYPHLPRDVDGIRGLIDDFFYDVILGRFASGRVKNYIFDVYVDKKERVWLVDFNPWGRSTDPLLFYWSELTTLDAEEEAHFRVVETENQVRQDPLASYRAPIDAVDLAKTTQGDAKQFEEFMKKCQKPSKQQIEEDMD